MSEFTLETADRLRRSVGDLVRAVQQIEGIPGGQIETLGFLFRDGPQSIAQLARRRRIRHQSMSSTVAELETQGLVTRSPDPADGRGVLIELTGPGSEAIRESRRRRSTLLLDAAEKALTADERSHLAQTAELFEKLREALPST
ncbi:MarR family winged helix-turn-helix transcriptional regulator [Herbiconiux daphne]|uniref:MarR family transcriptional regulator n=1 Tax=Herbiconiux daphne TaxID=2970914 RepID=A0ABT2H1D4_9MICO|nr:MarR family transcriptional regulator [Herbiconiux daphne]MCS5733754.1 MarR family transcriptional regulator [Herbiconiux daphne]